MTTHDPGTLYFLQVGANGPIKIGCTCGNIYMRIQQIQMGSPYELVWIGACRGNRDDEQDLHRELADHRLRGEWFHPTKPVLSAIAAKVGPDFSPEAFLDAVCYRRQRKMIVAALRRSGRQWHELETLAGIGPYGARDWRLNLAPPVPAVVGRLLESLPLLQTLPPKPKRQYIRRAVSPAPAEAVRP